MPKADDFDSLCPLLEDARNQFDTSCPWTGVTKFWNNDRSQFQQEISTDAEAIQAMSSLFFPDGEPVIRQQIFGNLITSDDDTILVSAESLLLELGLPEDETLEETVIEYELSTIDRLFDLSNAWSGGFVLEQLAEQTFSDQFEQGFAENLPLIAGTLIVVSLFTVLVFLKCNWVTSRAAVS